METYDRTLTRIGVIYKERKDALEMYNTTLSESEHVTRENIQFWPEDSDNIDRVDMVWDFTYSKYLPEGAQRIIRTRYSFHRIVHDKDVHNLSGMQFRGFHFCAGAWNPQVLNYLMSRLRG